MSLHIFFSCYMGLVSIICKFLCVVYCIFFASIACKGEKRDTNPVVMSVLLSVCL